MNRLMKVGVVSMAKFMGLLSLILGLFIFIPYGLVAILIGAVGGAASEEGGAGIAAAGVGVGLALMILGPIFYGVFAFIFGLIYALIINLVLWMCGGLELELR